MRMWHGLVLVPLLAGFVAAAPWSPAAGSNDTFDYANGQDVEGRFGTPNVAEDKFVFPTPAEFEAIAPDGPASATDTLSVDLFADPGREFQKIVATLSGTYSVESGDAEVSFEGTLSVDTGSGFVGVPIVFVPPSPITNGEGIVNGTATFFVPPGIDELSLSLSTTLNAEAEQGATSVIALLNTQIAVTTIPEPASAGVLFGLAGMLLRRRR